MQDNPYQSGSPPQITAPKSLGRLPPHTGPALFALFIFDALALLVMQFAYGSLDTDYQASVIAFFFRIGATVGANMFFLKNDRGFVYVAGSGLFAATDRLYIVMRLFYWNFSGLDITGGLLEPRFLINGIAFLYNVLLLWIIYLVHVRRNTGGSIDTSMRRTRSAH